MHSHGFVFVFEGPDGVGKTTLVDRVRQELVNVGRPVLAASFPGRQPGTLGAHVNDLHHRPAKYDVRTLTPDALQVLHIAAHVDTIESAIRPHVDIGGVVLLDRYWWSTWVYGRLSGVSTAALTRMIDLEHHYWRGLPPRAVFLLSRSPACVEIDRRNAFVEQAQEYKAVATRDQEARVVEISNDGPLETTVAAVVAVIQDMSRETPHRETSLAPPGDLSRQGREPVLPYDSANDGLVPELPACRHTVSMWSRLAPAQPTRVFDTYWRFATERQEIFFRRFGGAEPPWTRDLIFQRYKFTNAYRASDRVSQYLIRHVIYTGDQSARELFFRVILFKFFNRIETWQRLVEALGEPSATTFDFDRYDRVLTQLLRNGERLYSAAYIMPTGGKRWHDDHKHRMHLRLLEDMLRGRLPERIAECGSMQQAFAVLRACPTIGDFLAYQYVTDLNYSKITDFREDEFVVAGPGARDGIRKCFSTLGGLTESDLIRFVCERQQEECETRGLPFKSLWGRPLQLIDCQNLFCEVDKYARVHHPDVQGRTGRVRIKQQFRPKSDPIDYWYPPKWCLNERIAETRAGGASASGVVGRGGLDSAHY